MKRAIVLGLVMSLCLVSMARAAFVDQWSVPAFGSVEGNPYTDSDGNTWGAYQAPAYGSGDLANFTVLGWDSGYGRWGTGNASYWPAMQGLRGANMNSQTGALVFTPSQNGEYSLYGTVNFYNSDDSWAAAFLGIAKVNATDGSVTWLSNGGYRNAEVLDLASMTAGQNVSLTTSDRLVFYTTSYDGVYDYVYLNQAGIGFTPVPEPVTVGLLSLGVLFIRRK
jgi:hypothetical protein